MRFIFGLLFLSILTARAYIPCDPEEGEGSVVCVCNVTYCDTIDPIKEIPAGEYLHVVSTKDGQRFSASQGQMVRIDAPTIEKFVVHIDREVKRQPVIGFGGAFTDAAGLNLAKLDPKFQRVLLEHYYGKHGLEYTIGRIPIAGCDFSTRPYSYNDAVNDTELSSFALQDEDLNFKIPYIQMAKGIQPNLKLFGSPWSSPIWMKMNNWWTSSPFPAEMYPEYYGIWAKYFIKFLEHYKRHGIDIWAVTPQNEPEACFVPGFSWNCVGFNHHTMNTFIRDHLGPAIEASPFDTKIIILDGQRFLIMNWARTIYGDPITSKYVSGLGIHWYFNWLIGPNVMDQHHQEFPDYFMFATEACTGSGPNDLPVILGSWERGEEYSHDIIENLNHWVGGWTDWNLFLDMSGGPNWAANEVDAPILINEKDGLAYKQPMFYHMGHISKFMPAGSNVLTTTSEDFSGLEMVASERPDGQIGVVILNQQNDEVRLSIVDSLGGRIDINVGPRSIHSLVYSMPAERLPIDPPNKSSKLFISTFLLVLLTFISLI